jgi:endogenous inhibitor of DNA gyrase (YacG/DUF329 family)
MFSVTHVLCKRFGLAFSPLVLYFVFFLAILCPETTRPRTIAEMKEFNPHPCPHCKGQVEQRSSGIWPFCSKRCKMADLGKWSAEEYRIPVGPSEQFQPVDSMEQSSGEEDL